MQPYRSKFVLFLILVLPLFTVTIAQDLQSDMELIQSKDFSESRFDKRKVRFLTAHTHQFRVTYNPVTLLAGGLLYAYQKGVSRHFYANCYYRPSCSEFSRLLIREYGLLKGVVLSADRLSRCNQIAATGFRPYMFHEHTHKIHETVDIYRSGSKCTFIEP